MGCVATTLLSMVCFSPSIVPNITKSKNNCKANDMGVVHNKSTEPFT